MIRLREGRRAAPRQVLPAFDRRGVASNSSSNLGARPSNKARTYPGAAASMASFGRRQQMGDLRIIGHEFVSDAQVCCRVLAAGIRQREQPERLVGDPGAGVVAHDLLQGLPRLACGTERSQRFCEIDPGVDVLHVAVHRRHGRVRRLPQSGAARTEPGRACWNTAAESGHSACARSSAARAASRRPAGASMLPILSQGAPNPGSTAVANCHCSRASSIRPAPCSRLPRIRWSSPDPAPGERLGDRTDGTCVVAAFQADQAEVEARAIQRRIGRQCLAKPAFRNIEAPGREVDAAEQIHRGRIDRFERQRLRSELPGDFEITAGEGVARCGDEARDIDRRPLLR